MALRVGLVGAGLMGGHHARNLARTPTVRLVAVADPVLERARALAEPLGAAAESSAEALLGRVDAVVIAAPAETHTVLTRQYLEAGVHVLVEKPVATTLAEAEQSFALAAARGLVLQVGHLLRYHRGVGEMLGFGLQPERLEARRLMRTERGHDVSALMELMVHDLDLVLQLVGQAPVEACSWGRGPRGREHEVEVRLRFPSGASARLLASRVSDTPQRRLDLACGEDALALDFLEPCTLVHHRGGQLVSSRSFEGENPLAAQLAHFAARCLGSGSALDPRVDLDLLALALRLQAAMVPLPPSSDSFDKQ